MSYTVHQPGSDNAKQAKETLPSKKHGSAFEVVVAQDNQLQIDYDLNHIPERFYEIATILENERFAGFPPMSYHVSCSKSGNRHVTIQLPEPMPILERVAWQAAFGSDAGREALNLVAIKNNVKNPILLYEPKDKTTIEHKRRFREE